MRTLTIIFALFLGAQTVYADTLKDVSETKSLSSEIMQYFLKEEFVKGLDKAKAYWPLPPVEIDGLANQINTQWTLVKQRFGESTGIEFIREERLGDSFTRYFYLHKFENHAIYWSFTYYKPKSGWLINSVNFQDNLEFLFQPVE